jgi:crotonobetainyl-CoA:carnitine CoA-transferase CaiB-like acyl-CoA transferase
VSIPTNTGAPLAGRRVLDFGQYIAGPGAAMMLADQGADVIRIERPTGPSMESPANAVLNRRKRIVHLDLEHSRDRQEAFELASRADVLIENFRPGVMSRSGLGYEQVRAVNPRIVYLSLPGFSAEDADRSQIAAWEGVVAAAVGQFTDMGLNRVLMGIEASYSPLTLASAYGSVFGAMAVTLALRARLSTGKGEHIEVPLAAALTEGLAYNSLWIENLPTRYKSLRETEIERRRQEQLPMDLSYDDLQPLLDPFYRTYICRDGRPFYVVSEAHATHSERALRVLGIWDEMVAAGLPVVDPYLSRDSWPAGVDCTIRAYPLTQPWAGRLSRRMAVEFLKKDAAEWERLFGEAGAPAAAHRTTREWLHSAHARHSGLIIEVADSKYGKMLQPGPIAWLKECGPSINEANASPPREWLPVDRDRLSVKTTANPLNVTRPWLAGITILDLTNVIAGPTIAGTLARFGARVIKIDPVTPTYDPWNTIACGIYANQSKESALVDLKSPAGRKILARLLQVVDVVTINAAEKQLPALGLSIDRLRTDYPKVILCHLDAFGGPQTGPRSNYPGYDDLVQASTGIMERFGGSFASVEEHAHFGTIDVLAGIAAAFGAALALLRRETTGKADVARSSLAAAGQWLQARFMYDYEGRSPFDEPRGRETKGEGPFYRCYRASDQWFFLAGKSPSATDVVNSPLAAALAQQPGDIEKALEVQLSTEPVRFWQAHLARFGMAVQPLEALANIRKRTAAESRPYETVAYRHVMQHPCGRAVEHVLPKAVRLANTPLTPLAPSEKYGHSTRSLMSELGFSIPEIEAMLNSRAISESWCDPYLPD